MFSDLCGAPLSWVGTQPQPPSLPEAPRLPLLSLPTPACSSRLNSLGGGWIQSPPRGLSPTGSTELTLDNKELRREKRETRDWRILPAGHPKQK